MTYLLPGKNRVKFVYILIRLKLGEIVSFNINMDRFEKKTHNENLFAQEVCRDLMM